jgi:hypothetical protein
MNKAILAGLLVAGSAFGQQDYGKPPDIQMPDQIPTRPLQRYGRPRRESPHRM